MVCRGPKYKVVTQNCTLTPQIFMNPNYMFVQVTMYLVEADELVVNIISQVRLKKHQVQRKSIIICYDDSLVGWCVGGQHIKW